MGLVELLLGKENPVSGFVRDNRHAIRGAAAGFGQRPGFGNGLAAAAQGAAMGASADDAFRTSQEAEAKRQEQLASAIENIRTKYNRPEIADWLEATGEDGLDSAWQEVLTGMKPKGPIKASAGDVFLDPETYQPISSVPDPKASAEADKEAFNREKDLTGQYTGADPIKTYTVVRDSYERVRQSAEQNSGAGDMGLIYGYMKMLDPGSVVRESEFAMAAQAGSFGEQIQGLVTRIINGERLPETVRRQFVQNADSLYAEAAANAEAINDQFSTRAEEWGVDPTRFIRPVEQYEPFGGGGAEDPLGIR
jgi:hypothetical protein